MSTEAKNLNHNQLTEIFDFWRENNYNVSGTAKQFHTTRVAIANYRKHYDWDKRAKKIEQKKWAKEDRETVNREFKTHAVMKRVFEKEADAYLEKKHIPTGDPRTLVIIARYLDELGETPNNGDGNIVNIFNTHIGQNTDDVRRKLENAIAGLPDSKIKNRF